jgi:xylan 1,4-beta-xylosidase
MLNRRQMMISVGVTAAATALNGIAWAQSTVTVPVEIDLRRDIGPLEHKWSRCIGSDRASITLRESWRNDLVRFQKEAGIERVRFHGILNDDMGVMPGGLAGKLANFQNVDDAFDGILDRGVEPFVELSFMPGRLASGSTKVNFTYNANITPPKSADDWGVLIGQFVQHLVDRYGIAEVRKWYFEVWNEPNLKWFFTGTQDQYFEMYAAAAKAVKGVDPSLRVGGPATSSVAWVPDFLAFCERSNSPVDFISTHLYPGDDQKPIFGEANKYPQNDVIPKAMEMVRGQIDATRYKGLELWLGEWSSDSPAMIAYVITNCLPYVHCMSQWCLSGHFEELTIPSFQLKEGDNGWGMMAHHSIAKPQFNTYKLLHKLGERRLSGVGPVLASKTGRNVSALVWNLAAVNQPSGIPDASVVRKVTGSDKRLDILLKGAKPGQKVKVSYVDLVRGSPYPEWRALGSPKYPSKEQIARIKQAADIAEPETRKLDRNGRLLLEIPAEGVALIELVV